MLKLGGGGRSTLIGGIAWPCPWATRSPPGASIARAKGSTRWYTVGSRFMETLSRRAMRLALNNTVVFVRQARLTWSVRLAIVALAPLICVSGCRGKRKTAPGSGRGQTTAELSGARPPPPDAGTLPAPAEVPLPSRRGG